jgi:tetratricopeptide (TPR) repeat protein
MKTYTQALTIVLTGLLVVSVARGESAEEASASKAAARFQKAVELYREGSFEGALAEFRKAYQISPSYRVLYNIAQTQYALHDFVGAYKALKQYVAEGGSDISTERRAQVDEMSAKLAVRIGHLQISTNVAGADLRIDDIEVGRSPLLESVPVNVGTHKVTAKKTGAPDAVRVVTVAGEEVLGVALRIDEPVAPAPVAEAPARSSVVTAKAEPPLSASPALSVTLDATPPAPSHAGLIASVATTVALGGAAGVFGYLALRAQKNFKDQLDTYPNTRASIEDARTKSKNYGYITDALGAAAILSGGIATYFIVTYHGSPSPKSGKGTVVGLAPTVGGMLLEGRF